MALVLYCVQRPSRYFGNTTPLLMVLAVMPLMTLQTASAPWLWSLPFLFTFLGGVFADVLEGRQRKVFLAFAGMVLTAQGLVCVASLPGLAR